MRCAVLDVVSWFPGVLQQLWIDVTVRCRIQNVCVETRSACSCWGCGEKRSVMVRPCDRWSSKLMDDWAARAPSCCVIWWQRRRQTDSAARMLSDDGGLNWNGFC